MSIKKKVRSLIRKIVRGVRQSYKEQVRANIAKKYLYGEGIEIGALHNPLKLPHSVKVKYLDRMSASDLVKHYPELAELKVVEPDIIDDGEFLEKIPPDSLDFIIANHFIEHCQDPVGTLKIFINRLKNGGVIYMAVPDKRFTFDKPRPLTDFEHLLKDHEEGPEVSREQHFYEYAKFVKKKGIHNEDQIKKRAADLSKFGYSIHFHVWDKNSFVDFILRCQAERYLSLQLECIYSVQEEFICVLKKDMS